MLKKLIALMMALFTAIAFAAVDVNSADAAQLDTINGIGPAIAGKIVAERKNGNFKNWGDFVSRISGIGEKSAAKLSEAGLTVNGSSFNSISSKADNMTITKPATPAAAMVPATPAIKPTPAPAAVLKPAPTTQPAAAKAEAKPITVADTKAAAEKEKQDAAMAKKQAKEDKAAAAKKEKEEKAAAKKAGKDEAKPASAKASEPAKK